MVKFLRVSSIYKKYLLFYISIVLLSCMFISLGVLLVSVNELKQVIVAEQKSKLGLAATDLSKQFAVFEDIADKIRISTYYQRHYLERNKYNELELIRDFSKYLSYSQLTTEYFLLYPDSQYVFTSQYKSLGTVYLEDILGILDSKTLLDKIRSVSSSCMIPAGMKGHLAILPLHMKNSASLSNDGLLCFFITQDSILNRCRTVSAGFNNDIYVFFDGKPIANFMQSSDTGMISINSDRFEIKMNVSSSKLYTRMQNFGRISIIIIIIITLLLLVMAILAAYFTYNPIKKLMQRYSPPDAKIKNELEYIENMLNEEILSQKQRVVLVEQLSEQRTIIRQQLLLLVLSGQYDNEIYNQMKEVGIQLDGEGFCILTVSLPTQESASTITPLIEDLSDDNILYYAVNLKVKEHLAIVVSMKSKSYILDVEELLRELGDTIGIKLKISTGFVCQDPKQLQSSLLVALSKEQIKPGNTVSFQKEHQESIKNWYDDTDLNKMIEAIEHGNEEKAQFHLKLFAMTLDREYTSMLIRRYIYIDTMNAVMRKAHDWGASIPSNKISNLLLLEKTDSFVNEMSTIISELCVSGSDNINVINERDNSIMAYIDSHYADYETSLDKIGNEFGLSSKQVSRIVKKMTGHLFKEYVTMLKIRRAKELLVMDTMTIIQVSQSLNFSSISYFIKTFREVTGYTPANYKKFVR